MSDRSGMPQSFRALTPEIERELCELIHETAVIAEGDDEVAAPVVWEWTKSLFADSAPWKLTKIPKGGGKFRTIHAPKDPLMAISRGILHHILRRIPVHKSVHGSEPRTSVITNARVHAGFARALYNVDLKDAFPSTRRDRMMANLAPKIRSVLLDTTDLDPDEADILVEVLIDLMVVKVQRRGKTEQVLPQGFPTSPAVLNIVLMPVDRALSRYMKQLRAETGHDWRYTRYVDDLTFSTDQDHIPKAVRREIRKIVRKNGWQVNTSKLAYCGNAEESGDPELSTKAPRVTGLIIHEDGRLTVPPRKIKRWRALMHQLLQKDELTLDERDQVVGIASFLQMVYDGELPSAVRDVYLHCKERFGLRDAQTRRERFPERHDNSGD